MKSMLIATLLFGTVAFAQTTTTPTITKPSGPDKIILADESGKTLTTCEEGSSGTVVNCTGTFTGKDLDSLLTLIYQSLQLDADQINTANSNTERVGRIARYYLCDDMKLRKLKLDAECVQWLKDGPEDDPKAPAKKTPETKKYDF